MESSLADGESTSSLTDREKNGLRGPVKAYIEEPIYPSVTLGDGTTTPEIKGWYQSEYDAAGHLVVNRNRNPDKSEWAVSRTYDSSGKLLQITSGKVGAPPDLTLYAYDEGGRVKSITNSGAPDNPTTFHYDERGRKTKVQVSRAEDYRANLGANAGALFDSADMAPNLRGGGSTTTSYDASDRPVEIQVKDAQGQLVSRTVRSYDEHGRVREERQILDDPLHMFPEDVRAAMTAASQTSAQEVRAQITKLMGDEDGPVAVAFSYDAQGRIKQTIRRIFNEEATIETLYNEQGDVAAEITRSRQVGSAEEQRDIAPYAETRYAYQYDPRGNWTEKTTSYISSPDGEFTSSATTHRTITYF